MSGSWWILARGVAVAELLEPLLDVSDDERGTVGVVPYICSRPPLLLGKFRPDDREMSCPRSRCSRTVVKSVGDPRRESTCDARTGSSGKNADASDVESGSSNVSSVDE